MSTDPTARITAGDVKFSLAISCRPVVWRSSSRASSPRSRCRARCRSGTASGFLPRRDDREAQNSASRSAIWATRWAWRPPSNVGGEERRQDLLGEADADDPRPDRQHVGVVVGPRQSGGVQVVAERGTHAPDLVGRQLLALPAAADDDADLGVAVADGAADGGADRRVVDRGGRVGAVVDDRRGPARRARPRSAPSARTRRGRRRWRCAPSSRILRPRCCGRRVPIRDDRSTHARDHRRRPDAAPRRRHRRRHGAGGADGGGHRGRRGRRRARRSAGVRLDPRRQLAVVEVRQPGVGDRRAPRSVATPARLHDVGRQHAADARQHDVAGDPRRRPRRRGVDRRRGVADPHAGPQAERDARLADGARRTSRR